MYTNESVFLPEDRVLSPIYPALLLGILEQHHIPTAPVLRVLDEEDFRNFNRGGRISHAGFSRCIQYANSLSPIPQLGLEFGKRLDLASSGILGQIMLSCDTLGEAFQQLMEFFPLTGLSIRVSLAQHAEEAWVEVHHTHRQELPEGVEQFLIEALLMSWRVIFNYLVGRDFLYHRVTFRTSSIHEPENYQRAFGCPVLLDQESNRAYFDQRLLQARLPSANEVLKNVAQKRCRKKLELFRKRLSLRARVQQLLASSHQFPDLAQVANQLCTSARSLSRGLQAENTSFQTLLNEARCNRALVMLQTDIDIDQVAMALGYSDSSNFRRAFKQWTQMTPSEYRRQQEVAA